MGYHTEFRGEFDITPPLTPEQRAYLKAFNHTRRMRRDPEMLRTVPDPHREAVGLPLGTDGEYFVNGEGFFGQNQTADVVDANRPPGTQPDLYCGWVPNDEGTFLMWDGGEKFYEYAAWLRYLIEHFFKPWGRTLDGSIEWQGQDWDDRGELAITDNKLTIRRAHVYYTEDA